MKPRTVELILKKCLAHRDGEPVLVVADPATEPLAQAFQKAATDMGIKASLVSVPAGGEPCPDAAEALKTSPTAVLFMETPLSRTRSLNDACARQGLRAASLSEAETTRLEKLAELDGSKELAGLLEEARVKNDGSPAAILPVVTPEAFRVLFQNSNDPQYALDLDTQRFLEVNPSLERLTGYSREELLHPSLTLAQLIARESLATYHQKRESRRIVTAERYDLRLVTKSSSKIPVEVSVRRITLSGHEVELVALRDLSRRKKFEQDLWEKIEELGYANNRIYALTEKIRRVPELTPQLLHITDEGELLERTAQLLCAREGLAYADVTFHLLREETLDLAYTTTQTKKRKVKLTADHKLVKILKGEDPGGMTGREAVLPLKGRERNLGVMEVFFHPKEIEVLQGNDRALKGYKDLLETLSNVIGLLVDNLRLYETVRIQSIVDHLTGVYNRRFFDVKLTEELSRAARYHRELGLVLMDVDHFKQINDKISYKQGDLVLSEVARQFKTNTRDADFVCRYGGDEFAVLMPETSYEGTMAKAESLRKVVRELALKNPLDPKQPLKLTLSAGVTAYHPGIKTPEDFLKGVDEAVHEAKRTGRDRVCGSRPPEKA